MRQLNVPRVLIWSILSALLILGPATSPLKLVEYVRANGPVLSKWAETTPLIDGYLSPGWWGIPAEWDDADRVDFELSWGAETHNASLYVKNDYINLYLAFVIEDEDFDVNDRLVFNFDNDHDGGKEIGDDQLWMEMHISFTPEEHQAGLFKDGFFPTPSDAPSWFDDVTSGGDQDGVGAVQFTGATPSEPGSYVVEVTHPLNTVDDSHDFSLGVGGVGVGDIVGINVIYLDASVAGDGWPTLTWGDWSQMASITIAGPPIPPPRHLRRNLEIYGIEITQAVQYFNDIGYADNSLPLAYGKSTIVRVYIDLGFMVESTMVTVYLYATTSSGISLAHVGAWGSNGPLTEDAQIPGFLSPLFDFYREKDSYTANFLLPDYWVMLGSVNLVAFVKAPVGVSELSYADNWMSWQTISFTPTKPPRIGYYLIDYRPTAPGPGPNIPSPLKEAIAYQFFEKVTPMPDLSDPIQYVYLGTIRWEGPSFTYPDGTFHEQNQEELLTELAERWEALAREGDIYDLICGLYGGVVNTTIGQANGHMGNWPPVFVAHENRSWSFAHEIGHSWPTLLPHSWDDHDNPYFGTDRANSSQTYGYDVQRNWHPNELRTVVKVPVHISGTGRYGALMSYKTRWISPYEWLEFMEGYDPPFEGLGISALSAVQSSSPGILVSGEIYNNNTGNLRPIFQTPSTLNNTVPSGPYVVELRGPSPDETLLYSSSFNVSFESDACAEGLPPINRASFMLDLPYMTETYSVSLWNCTISPPVLLDKITASPNPPSVAITYPNGGENMGDSIDVTWTAFDPDTGGDPMTFRLFYSSDNGLTWKPLSPRITGTNYTIDTSRLPGGSQCLFRIQASDGFHTAEDQSDSVFTAVDKPPQDCLSYFQDAVESEPYLETARERYSIRSHGSFGILKGYAFDAEDGVLQDSALSWTSDLEGLLGTGRVLSVADLRPGTHNITMTATDSHGNNATDSFMVTVELHNLRVAQGSADSTIVNQGQIMNINFTIMNDGNVNETFEAYVYAISGNPSVPDLLIGNQSVMDLQPNENLTLAFVWNTTDVASGNYTLCCYAAQVLGESHMSDNYLACGVVEVVFFPWDVNFDEKVDITDIVQVIAVYGTTPESPNWNQYCDVNKDEKVDITDISMVISHYGEQM